MISSKKMPRKREHYKSQDDKHLDERLKTRDESFSSFFLLLAISFFYWEIREFREFRETKKSPSQEGDLGGG